MDEPTIQMTTETFQRGDRIDIGTGYSCDKGLVISDNNGIVSWRSDCGGIYRTPEK